MIHRCVRGFTLIESIMYTALVAILMVAIFTTLDYSLAAQARMTDQIRRDDHAEFVLSKIGWFLRHATAIMNPELNSQSSELHCMIFDEEVHDMSIRENNGDLVAINDGVFSILISKNDGLRSFRVLSNNDIITVFFSIDEQDYSKTYVLP